MSDLRETTVPRRVRGLGGGLWRPEVQQALMRHALLLGTLLLVVVFTIYAPFFLTMGNFTEIMRQSAPVLAVAVPTALLLICGKVDLGIGSTFALGGVTCGLLMNDANVAPLLATAGGVCAGAAIGLFNGVCCSILRWSPVIVTLGMLTAVRGFVLLIAPDPVFGFSAGFTDFGNGDLAGIPYVLFVAAALAVIAFVVLRLMPVGRHLFAIGVNEEAAYLAGIRVQRITLIAFVATGAVAALGGVMLSATLGSAPAGSLGVGFEIQVLTAVLLGGVGFTGGRGGIGGVVLGVAFLAILANGLVLLNVPASTTLLISGFALVLAAGLDRAVEKTGRAA